MNRLELFQQIKKKSSYLCVGLDTDIEKIPQHLLKHEDPIFEFNRQIIEATKEYAVAYKPNLAFYEAHGVKGWTSLQKTLDIIPKDIFTIADAKRGDIGNTSSLYARAFFKELNFDSITVARTIPLHLHTPFPIFISITTPLCQPPKIPPFATSLSTVVSPRVERNIGQPKSSSKKWKRKTSASMRAPFATM